MLNRSCPGSARPARRRNAQRGLSLVELMVGITIGLIIVAAMSLLTSTQLAENRRLMLEAQLQQDLRASGDILARELRRSGAAQINTVLQLMAADARTPPPENDKAFVIVNSRVVPLPANLSGAQLRYDYEPSDGISSSNADDERFGFRLNATRGVLQLRLAGGQWQDLTDPGVLRVTAFDFSVNDTTASAERMPCPRLCSDGSNNCWPQAVVTEVSYRITAQARNDASVQRSVEGQVRVRNTSVRYNTPGGLSGGGLLCP